MSDAIMIFYRFAIKCRFPVLMRRKISFLANLVFKKIQIFINSNFGRNKNQTGLIFEKQYFLTKYY